MNSDGIRISNKLKSFICSDPGVYHVGLVDRFGHEMISVACVTENDQRRLMEQFGNVFEGFGIAYLSPAWNVGDIISEYRSKLEEIMADGSYALPNSQKSLMYSKVYSDAKRDEWIVWTRFTSEERRQFLKQIFTLKRHIDPSAVNCGDKFL